MPLIKSSSPTGFAKDAIVLDLGDLHRQGEQIMTRARDRAAQILTNAQAERERLIAGASDQGQAQGHAKGLDAGLAQGLQQGREAALAEHRELLGKLGESWVDALERFLAVRQHLLADGRTEVVQLAALMAEKVVKRTIQLDPTVVMDQLQAVLALVMRPSRLTVGVNPADRPLLEAALPGVVKSFSAVSHVELIDDDKLARGSCVARLGDLDAAASTPAGEIDASIATQLDRLVEALLPDHDQGRGAGNGATAPEPPALSPAKPPPAGPPPSEPAP